ncbi:MAG: hypothetical protein IPL78_25995 [Chloroflexi bacterium]|nr:hypothetical protein [Chloroflexota bacterium]
MNIWDFGGQEIMHATHQFFSLNVASTFSSRCPSKGKTKAGRVLADHHQQLCPDAPVLIIINKWDQHRLDINRRGLQEKYPAIKGFVCTSARDDRGIDELKTEVAALLAEMEHVDSSFPDSWMKVKNTLTTMQTERDYLPYTAYQQICQDSGVTYASSPTDPHPLSA